MIVTRICSKCKLPFTIYWDDWDEVCPDCADEEDEICEDEEGYTEYDANAVTLVIRLLEVR